MSLISTFYTGDRDRIVDAFIRDDERALASDAIVAAKADLPSNVWPEELDCLVRCACTLLKRPAMTFAELKEQDFVVSSSPDPDFGISEMSDAFAELFASIPLSQVDELYDMLIAELEKAEPVWSAPPKTAMQRLLENIGDKIASVAMLAVVLPLLAASWLFSPSYRRDSRKNREKLKTAAGSPDPGAECADNGLAALITTCKTAREQHRTVLYAWLL